MHCWPCGRVRCIIGSILQGGEHSTRLLLAVAAVVFGLPWLPLGQAILAIQLQEYASLAADGSGCLVETLPSLAGGLVAVHAEH
jgi:hypothetical protein